MNFTRGVLEVAVNKTFVCLDPKEKVERVNTLDPYQCV